MVSGILWSSVVARMKNDVRGRFFEGFEEGVPRARREHMHFVDDVDFFGAQSGGEFHGFAELANIIDAVVGRAVYLDHVERAIFFEGSAMGAYAAGLLAFFSIGAIYRRCEKSRDGRFPGAARTREEVGLRQKVIFEGIGECRDNMRLSRDIAPALRSVFSVESRHREIQNEKCKKKNENVKYQLTLISATL
jgi:hypothetical protein